jgi:hypothetical protein
MFNPLLIFKPEVEQGPANDIILKIFTDKNSIFQIYLL